MNPLLATLFAALTQLASYGAPGVEPALVRVTPQELSQMARCECGVKAYYRNGGQEVYLRTDLDPEGNVMDRSILLHELVHHRQDASGRFNHLGEAERWHAREREAFAIQRAYLATQQVAAGFGGVNHD